MLFRSSTMARIDVLRKVLYGGARSTDTTSETVLQRTHLPTDAHSFAKYYKGDDLDKLTPFSAAQLAPTRASSSQRVLHIDSVNRNGRYNNRTDKINDRASPDNSTASSSQSCAPEVLALYGGDTAAVPTVYN